MNWSAVTSRSPSRQRQLPCHHGLARVEVGFRAQSPVSTGWARAPGRSLRRRRRPARAETAAHGEGVAKKAVRDGEKWMERIE